MSELLIGCGNSRRKKLTLDGFEWADLTTIDHDPNCGADVVHDLDEYPWPFVDDAFDEAHAYCVLEHLGRQGDYRSFFALFGEIHRIIKPGGLFFAVVPSLESEWLWGDPSHTRAFAPNCLTFLSQAQYAQQVGVTTMTDFRWLWKGDFETIDAQDDGDDFKFVLKAIKPARSMT